MQYRYSKHEFLLCCKIRSAPQSRRKLYSCLALPGKHVLCCYWLQLQELNNWFKEDAIQLINLSPALDSNEYNFLVNYPLLFDSLS